MKSIRTPLHKNSADIFRTFLDSIGLQEVIIGNYEHISDRWYHSDCICYAYSEKSNETVAILTHIALKYGNLHNAFSDYMSSFETSSVNDPYFNWIP